MLLRARYQQISPSKRDLTTGWNSYIFLAISHLLIIILISFSLLVQTLFGSESLLANYSLMILNCFDKSYHYSWDLSQATTCPINYFLQSNRFRSLVMSNATFWSVKCLLLLYSSFHKFTYLSCHWIFAILLEIWNNVSDNERKVLIKLNSTERED